MDRTWLFVGAVGPLVLGCWSPTLAPATPPRSEPGEIRVRLDRVDQAIRQVRSSGWYGTVYFELGVGAPPDALLLWVELPLDASGPCEGGTNADRVSVDGRDVSPAAPASIGGAHRVEAAFRHFRRDYAPDFHFLDLSFQTAAGKRCERLKVAGPPDPGWHAVKRGEFGMVMGADVPIHAVANTSGLVPLQLAMADRIGHVRLAVEPGLFAIGVCGACSADEHGKRPPALAVPFGGGATWYPFSSDGFGLEVRLREYALWAPSDTGFHFTMLHAPAGVVHLGLAASKPRDGLSVGPRVADVDLEIPVGIVAAHEDTGNHVEPYFGAGVSIWWWR